jgi:thymidylate kinase
MFISWIGPLDCNSVARKESLFPMPEKKRSPRQATFTVALIGPDGSGKTTISRKVREAFPNLIQSIYMGVNLDSSNHMLPTSRLLHTIKRLAGSKPDTAGPYDPQRQQKVAPKGRLKRTSSTIKSMVRLLHRISEEWYRQALAWYYQYRGWIVLFDRHFFSDYYAYDIAATGHQQTLSRKIHGQMLMHVYPKPDLIIYLDAPAEVLFARKGEGTLDLLEQRRQDYLDLRDQVRHFAVVDASQPIEAVTRHVIELIWSLYAARAQGKLEPNYAAHETK